MLRAIGLALTDLGDRRILAIMLQALGLALLVFVLLGGSMFWLLAGADPCSLAGMDTCSLDTGSSALGAVALTLLGIWFLFPAVAIAVIAAFTDRIAAAVERTARTPLGKPANPL